MRTRPRARARRSLIAVIAGSLTAAGCAASVPAPVAGGTGTPARQPATASHPASHPATAASPACPGSAVPPGASGAPAQRLGAGALTGLQFVSATTGWAVGQDEILATSDGGAHWVVQQSGQLNLTSADFISARTGWAVGTGVLLATADGGAHWTRLPEPCPVIRSVHFISPSTGFAVAGGAAAGSPDPAVPGTGGVVLRTSDGGHTWRPLATPPDAQTVCFSDPAYGWLGAGGRLYLSVDGGRYWMPATPAPASGQAGYGPEMEVQCAGDSSAWAVRVGPGVAMNQQPHVGYHADKASTMALFAEQYFQAPGTRPAAPSPGSVAGPLSAISPSAAAFVDSCPACGYGTAPWDLATASGATLTRKGNVGGISQPEAASFLSGKAGWVAGIKVIGKAGTLRQQQRIVATDDGGRTWHVQYAGPWTG